MKRKLNKDGFRKCVKCKIEKPLTNDFFHRDKNRMGGLMYKCKDCEKGRKDKRDYKTRFAAMSIDALKRYKQRQAAYNRSEMGKCISAFKAYQTFDKRKGLMTDITKTDIVSARAELCMYCGSPATGLDRKNNSVGHTKENCVPACKECNVARMDNFSHEEMIHIGETIRLIKAERELRQFGTCIL
jgi:hypothetical protein